MPMISEHVYKLLLSIAVTTTLGVVGTVIWDLRELTSTLARLTESQKQFVTQQSFPQMMRDHAVMAPETRGRIDALERQMAQCCPAGGVRH